VGLVAGVKMKQREGGQIAGVEIDGGDVEEAEEMGLGSHDV